MKPRRTPSDGTAARKCAERNRKRLSQIVCARTSSAAACLSTKGGRQKAAERPPPLKSFDFNALLPPRHSIRASPGCRAPLHLYSAAEHARVWLHCASDASTIASCPAMRDKPSGQKNKTPVVDDGSSDALWFAVARAPSRRENVPAAVDERAVSTANHWRMEEREFRRREAPMIYGKFRPVCGPIAKYPTDTTGCSEQLKELRNVTIIERRLS